jgi:Na+/phosphate symporter
MRRWTKPGALLSSLFLFVLSIQMLKEGAGVLAPFLVGLFSLQGPVNTLGLGWLSAYLVLSGSPIAAVSLTFFDAGSLSSTETFSMIIGSRMGASLIVLLIGFLYTLRGHQREESLGMGLLSLLVTWSLYAPALFVGMALLRSGLLDPLRFTSPALLLFLIDRLIDPIVSPLARTFGPLLLFFLGLALLLLSFKLFDHAVPEIDLRRTRFGDLTHHLYRPAPMFLLGFLITLISFSVTLSLSLLVPFAARGYVKTENVVPYIMGANITTLIDTLFAALLLNNPQAFTIILAAIVSTLLVSLPAVLGLFRPYERAVLRALFLIHRSPRSLSAFLLIAFLLPLFLLLV